MKVDLIDYMGTDLTVVNSARVSFDKRSEWDWRPSDTHENCLSERDKKLIRYLADHDHWTPFSHVQITMREKVPIFVARQRFKHTVGFTYNEVSRRYVDSEPEFYIPESWRRRAEDKKQGSSDETVDSFRFYGTVESWNAEPMNEYYSLLESVRCLYDSLIEAGVAPEQARMVLPQSMYTEYYVTGSLAAWARAYNLRSKPDAQKEIRDLAKMWDERIQTLWSLRYSWNALTDRNKKPPE